MNDAGYAAHTRQPTSGEAEIQAVRFHSLHVNIYFVHLTNTTLAADGQRRHNRESMAR